MPSLTTGGAIVRDTVETRPYQETPINRNQIRNHVRLLDASMKLSHFMSDTKSIIKQMKSSKSGISLGVNNLQGIVEHFDQNFATVLRDDIVPSMHIPGNTLYAYRRISNAARRAGGLPKSMSSILLNQSYTIRKTKVKRQGIKYPHRRTLPINRRPPHIVCSPLDETEFKPQEALECYQKCKSKTKCVNEWKKRKYIPSLTSFYDQVKRKRADKAYSPPETWKTSGRPPVCEVVKFFKLSASGSTGQVTTNRSNRHILEREALEEAESKAGTYLPFSHPTVCTTTVENYKTLIGTGTRRIPKKIQQKTDNRHTAEASVMSTVSFLMTIASTHFFLGEKVRLYHRHDTKKETK